MSEQINAGHGMGGILLAFLGGAVVGGAAAILFAPKSGEQTRKRFAEMAKNGRERAERVPAAVREASHAATVAFGKAMRQAV